MLFIFYLCGIIIAAVSIYFWGIGFPTDISEWKAQFSILPIIATILAIGSLYRTLSGQKSQQKQFDLSQQTQKEQFKTSQRNQQAQFEAAQRIHVDQQQAERNRSNSEYFSHHAVRCLERAFNVISNNETRESPVKNRLEWLTCGRWLVTAKRMASNITAPEVQQTFEVEQEYWRGKFYNFIDPHNAQGFASSLGNFTESRIGRGDSIEPKSATVIYKFIELPDDWNDPIDEVPGYTEDELQQLRVHRSGLREYLSRHL